MLTSRTRSDARAVLARARRDGHRIAFVPTMGFLHEGHLRLLDLARRSADFVVMSIFVNPLQFGAGEDLGRYPRDPDGDAAKAAGRGADLLFTPDVEEMYGAGRDIRVVPGALATRWEGASRPGHFDGVLTVVAKLFNIVQPDSAVFGQKDYQQVALVRAMVRQLDFPIDVVVAPTTRDEDGLAMSSRNSYLAPDERRDALVLSRALASTAMAFDAGERETSVLERAGRAVLDARPSVRLEYFAVVDGATLEPVSHAREDAVAIVAARVGATRLIDNRVLGRP